MWQTYNYKVFLIVCLYIAVGEPVVKRGPVGVPLTGLTPPYFCACCPTRTWISCSFYFQIWSERVLFILLLVSMETQLSTRKPMTHWMLPYRIVLYHLLILNLLLWNVFENHGKTAGSSKFITNYTQYFPKVVKMFHFRQVQMHTELR
jgi:hypothetical protein